MSRLKPRNQHLESPLPGAWTAAPIYSVCTCKSSTLTLSDAQDAGRYPLYDANKQVGYSDSQAIPEPYLSIIKDGAGVGRVRRMRGGSSFLATMNGLVPKVGSDLPWLQYLFECIDLVGKEATTIPHIYFNEYSKLRVPIPPPRDREIIGRFLDVETAKIDHLIAKQRELLALVDERQALMRDIVFSGYVGTGKRLKWYLSEMNTRLGDGDPNGQPLLSVSIHWGVSPRAESVGEESSAASFEKYKIVEAGDVILNRMRAFQGAVGFSHCKGFTSPDYAVFRSGSEVDPAWLMQVMKTQRFVDEMKKRLTGIGGTEGGKVRTPRINSDDLLDIRINIPSHSMQYRDTSEYLNYMQDMARIKEKVESHIKLAQERRSALITAVVTGQIEV